VHDGDQGSGVDIAIWVDDESLDSVDDPVSRKALRAALDALGYLAVGQRGRLDELRSVWRTAFLFLFVRRTQVQRVLSAFSVQLLFHLLLLPEERLFVQRVVQRVVCLRLFLILRTSSRSFAH